MRIVTFSDNNSMRTGAVVDKRIIDLNAAAATLGLPAVGDILTILSKEDGLSRAQEVVTATNGKYGSWWHEYGDVKLLAPIPRPPKVLAVALNYHDFCVRGNLESPKALKVFTKVGTTVIGPYDDVCLPPGRKVTYEGELGVVMGRRGKNICVADAFDYVAGYTVVNDLTANDAVKEDVQLMRGKNYDTFCPMGPIIVTKDEITDPYNLNIRTTVNGVLRQEASVGQMIFKIDEIINYFSSFLTLEPGDVIATGTPAGTALQHNPPAFLFPDDIVSVTVAEVGTITNKTR